MYVAKDLQPSSRYLDLDYANEYLDDLAPDVAIARLRLHC